MHDLDRRMFEAEGRGEELEDEQEFHELLGELVQTEGGQSFEAPGSAGGLDRSAREVALASELLEVQTEQELEQFLGNLFRLATGAGRKFLRSPSGRRLGGILKQAATQALPPVADAVGAAAAPPPGGDDGRSPAELGLELEGLSQEDREFEVARAFVRFADAATRSAAQAPSGRAAVDTARAAATAAARKYLPGLLAQHPGRGRDGGSRLDTTGRSEMSAYDTRESEYLELEGGELEAQEWESESESEWENQEWESESESEWESEWETQEWEGESTQAETELVSELLEITGEQELEQFLGKLFRKAAKTVGGAIKAPVGRALTSTLKNVARKALPIAGGALGSFLLPGIGGGLGSQVGSMASRMFELEMEGMGEQEAEFEVGRRFVRLASTAARHAARAPGSTPPRAVAKAALVTAARRHAPGLLRGTPPGRRGRPAPRRQPPQRRPRRRPVTGTWAYGGPPERCVCGGEPPSHQDGADAEPDVDDADGTADSGEGELSGGSGRQGKAHTGRWVRRGRKIVLMGV